MKAFNKGIRKKLWLILTMSVLLMIGSTVTASAAGDSISSATDISLNTSYSGSISSSNTTDVYKFTLSTSGEITLTSTAYMKFVYYYIYDADGNTLWNTGLSWDSTSEQITVDETFDLTSGTYYFAVKQNNAATGDYTFQIDFTSAGESFAETQGGVNNSIAASQSISIGTTYTGQIAENDDQDIYKFTLSTSGEVTLTSTAYMKFVYYHIYDADGDSLWDTGLSWNSTTEQITVDESLDLTAGTYYLAVAKNNASTGKYTFKISFTSASESFAETQGGNNNKLATADSISLNKTYKGQLAVNDTKDFYKFTISDDNVITVTSTAYMKFIYYHIYDSDGDTVWSKGASCSSTTGEITLSESVTLSAGTYYLAVSQNNACTGNYKIKIKSTISSSNVTLSTTSCTYNGKVRTPSVTVKNAAGIILTEDTDYTVTTPSGRKNAGTYTYTITGTGDYTGTVTKTLTIKSVSIKTSSSAYVSCKLSSTSYTYNGSAKKPSVTLKVKVNGSTKTLSKSSSSGYTVKYSNNTKIGKATVTITGTGNYTGTITKTFKILPKKGTISSLKSSAKKKMTVKWSTISGSVTKYQVRYRVKGTSTWTTKTYSSSTKSKTITGLKSGKTYQVQVRAYKTVSGTKYYGSWSSTKTVKVK